MFLKTRADNANTTAASPPQPVVLEPSGDFDGNDGKWSSFYINLGDDESGHGQNFKVLISTSSPITLVPQQNEWCNQDCAEKRGIELFDSKQPLGYDSSSSKAWKQAGLFEIPLPDWWSGNKSLAGTFGSENVGLGESSPQSLILGGQVVVEYTWDDFFMGSFGLAAGAINTGSGSQDPFLANLNHAANTIPSTSYGYTAGASYRNNGKGEVGNLVLGGYDASRVSIDRGVSIDFPNDKNHSLVVGVESIQYTPDPDIEANSFSFTSSSDGFYATIDSTLPYLWLPDDICAHFADRFQLEYDDKSNYYTVNASAHQNNQRNNATVSFKIGRTSHDSNEFANIDLPYSAFDLELDAPIADNATQYFPIRLSSNGRYVLGRTFFQEAYVVVDYERLNFTVAPAYYAEPMPEQNLVPIYNKTYSPATPTPTPIPGSGGGLSPGAVAGIVVGVVLALLLAALGAFFWWKKRRPAKAPEYSEKASEIDTMVAGNEVKHRRVSELDSEPPNSPKSSTLGGYYGDRDKDVSPFPPINEMESPPAELYSPPPMTGTPGSEGNRSDYFVAGNKVKRRGATRESTGNNTPGTPAPIAELPGDDGQYQVGGVHFEPVASPLGSPTHGRGPSDSSLQLKIDEVMKRTKAKASPVPKEGAPPPKEGAQSDAKDGATKDNTENIEKEEGANTVGPLERRPSHGRGLSDTTIQSDSTAVSQPTPEEREQWASGGDDPEHRRPLSE